MNATTEATGQIQPPADATNTPLILTGDGYQLLVPPEAVALRDSLLAAAKHVTTVRTNDQSADAQHVGRKLAAMRIAVEKSRAEIKKPVLEIGKRIDAAAKEFVTTIEAEENRIRTLVGDHAAEVERARRAAEEAERRAADEARRAREEAERAAAAAEAARAAKVTVAELAAAKQAERAAEEARREALAARMDASEVVSETRVAEGVRFVWDFEVTNIDKLYRDEPELVTLTPKRLEIAQRIKEIAARFDDQDVIEVFREIGIKAFKKAVMASR